jgi:hypothetical protein
MNIDMTKAHDLIPDFITVVERWYSEWHYYLSPKSSF